MDTKCLKCESVCVCVCMLKCHPGVTVWSSFEYYGRCSYVSAMASQPYNMQSQNFTGVQLRSQWWAQLNPYWWLICDPIARWTQFYVNKTDISYKLAMLACCWDWFAYFPDSFSLSSTNKQQQTQRKKLVSATVRSVHSWKTKNLIEISHEGWCILIAFVVYGSIFLPPACWCHCCRILCVFVSHHRLVERRFLCHVWAGDWCLSPSCCTVCLHAMLIFLWVYCRPMKLLSTSGYNFYVHTLT